jgi:competence protein ComEA
LNKLVAALAALLAASAFAGVDANTASQAELEAISGIGPTLSTAIINERKKGDFKDWNDLFRRVRGVGERSAAKLSAGGMTIGGKAYGGAGEKPQAASAQSPAGSAPAK